MMAVRFAKWLSSLPPWELDLPIVYLDGRYWTPREISKELEKGGELASRLLQALKSLLTAPRQALRPLAQKRLLTLLEKYPVEVAVLSIEKPRYTTEELKNLVERDADFGSQMIDNEINWIFNITLKNLQVVG